MSVARQRTDIETELMTQMELARPGFVIYGENSDEKVPSDIEWARMSLTIIDMVYPCLGQDRTETDGIFNTQVFVPLSSGAGLASTIVDEVRAILKASNLTGIEFLNFDVATGVVESGWYILLLRANYRAQD